MRLLDKRIMSHFDYLILIFIAPLIILSYVLISEANDALASKQVFYYTISLFIFILVFMFPLRKNLRLVPFLYWIGILLLLAVEFIGVTKLGAKRWIHIPLLDTTIQPSEIIILHLFTINYFFKTDFIVKAFSSGLALLIFLNMSVNILMVIGFAPVVGIPLPLFSYGGSSFINFIVTFAILENLLAFRYMDMYNYERKM